MVDDEDYSIGKSIRKRRIELGMSQQELAELSKLSINYISRVERANTANLSVKVLIAISEALNIDINNLIYPDKKHKTSYIVGKQDLKLSELDPNTADEVRKLISKLITELKK